MRNYIAIIAIALANCIGPFPVSAQEIWPGDVNNNGVVNAVDLLYWGQAFGSTGPIRSNATTEWQAQPITGFWPQSFPNGLNYAYADCDGNGAIEENDFDDGIEDNFGETHGIPQSDGFVNGAPGSAPRIHLTPSATLVEPGATVDIRLSLGDQDFPVSGFYGIALLLSYDSELLDDDDGFEFEFEEGAGNWITAPKKEAFFPDENIPGKAQIAITRLDQQSQSTGFGEVGKFSIVIEDIIVGLEADTFHLRVDSILLIDASLNTYPVVPDTASIIVAKDSALVGTSSERENIPARVYPNPAKRTCYIQCPERISQLLLFDALGRTIPLSPHRVEEHIYQVAIPNVPSGIYWLMGTTASGSFRRKIIIN